MFYSQYLFAIGVLPCLDLDDFYHPFVFASQQILLVLFELLPTLRGYHSLWHIVPDILEFSIVQDPQLEFGSVFGLFIRHYSVHPF